MEIDMERYELKPFIKCVVLDVSIFETKVVDECNFSYEDTEGMMEFEEKYHGNDDYLVIKIEM